MPDLSLSLYRLALDPAQDAVIPGSGVALVLSHEGDLSIDGRSLGIGEGRLTRAGAALRAQGADPSLALAFVLSEDAAVEGALASERISVDFPCVVRLDEVAFPPGAVAYRHVHAGAGFRHLRWGHLQLEADDHAFEAHPGDTWFEAANSPVRATATEHAHETRFVRCMVIPPDYEGKPTIRILDPDDAALPKRQVTHRHIDQRLACWPHVEAG